jgi:hypothetical protein
MIIMKLALVIALLLSYSIRDFLCRVEKKTCWYVQQCNLAISHEIEKVKVGRLTPAPIYLY